MQWLHPPPGMGQATHRWRGASAWFRSTGSRNNCSARSLFCSSTMPCKLAHWFVRVAIPAVVVVAMARGSSLHAVNPSDCVRLQDGEVDCAAAIAQAVALCRAQRGTCEVRLAHGATYPVRCQPGARPSTAQTELPAVSLDNTANLTFGAAVCIPQVSAMPGGGGTGADCSPATILVHYTPDGCAGIAAVNASGLTVRNVVVDAWRLPFTVGTVVGVSNLSLSLELEVDVGGGREYAWNMSRYPWLEHIETSSVVPSGAQAYRSLKERDIGRNLTASRSNAAGTEVKLEYNLFSAARRSLQQGDRVFLKHYGNLQSWGIYGFGVAGMRVENCTLYSVSGMGFRCDFCTGSYELIRSHVAIRPLSVRPMSITADATHFMHHSGTVSLLQSSMQGQGDDGFNLHGNFIVISGIHADRHGVTYVDESGAGWITAAPAHMVGDTVTFFNRHTLQVLGRGLIAAADNTTVRFQEALPATFRRYDMFLSRDRVASLRVEGCFFGNSNARGMIVSGTDVVIVNNSFVNLESAGLEFIEGGCGAKAGDYTEGPFPTTVQIRDNLFRDTAAVQHGTSINGHAQLQMCGCVPAGTCGLSGLYPTKPSPEALLVPVGQSGHVRSTKFLLAGPARLTTFKYLVQAGRPHPKGARMALYTSSPDGVYPASLVSEAVFVNASLVAAANSDATWVSVPAPSQPDLQAGLYWLCHYYEDGEWATAETLGSGRLAKLPPSAGQPFPKQMSQYRSLWHNDGVPLPTFAVGWVPLAQPTTSELWCDIGATLPPPLMRDVGAAGNGRITEPGFFLVSHWRSPPDLGPLSTRVASHLFSHRQAARACF